MTSRTSTSPPCYAEEFEDYVLGRDRTAQPLSELLAQVRACRRCEPQLPLGARPLLQVDCRARILVVGQAPGRKAHAAATPFPDVSGDRLRNWMGVDRARFYDPGRIAILPMAFCYPGTGNSGDLPPPPECARHWRSRLLAHLPRVELTLLVGRYALAWHLPETARQPLGTIVENWETYWPRLLPMPHPSPRNQRWLRERPWFEQRVLPLLRARVGELLAD